ncbi:hypothetical protein INH39_18305 [Massilia violaceinigra]|uniref:Paeninodin family lasso peptide n=1 Tax=Massilia violaceinigra TaxID=2045208 RepID=A0ABY4A479_9BURK|nr:hypothetical protein [Massilia violaceinigra]UOD27473.1 hypothetical protein INH39_18305 [Massilia violaceinigra]
MRALNMNELDYVSGGDGDGNANDNAGNNGTVGSNPGGPVNPPFIPTEPWVDSDGNINFPP